jgi:putative two-component system response regulator
METTGLTENAHLFKQLIEYAKDLSRVYESEKQKDKALNEANRQLIKFADDLNKTFSGLKAAHRELQEAYLDTIQRLVMAAEYKDEDTGDHIRRMSLGSALIARKIGLPAEDVQNILYASPMHDVGKIGIPDSILMKPGKLTDDEFALIKTHTLIGGKILENSKSKILQVARKIAISHHEKWNGKGYPHGLAGDDIPVEARIVGVLDVFDALTSKRPYKDPYPTAVACKIIEKERGAHFAPDLVDVFLENIDEILAIHAEVKSGKETRLSDFIISERDEADGTFKSISENT